MNRAADRYITGALLGRGGMGVVHRATDRATGRPVALKRLAVGHDAEPAFRARFTREVRAMARVHHPNVVGIHASGEDADGPWFVMDLCEGGTLADRLRDSPLSPVEARHLASDVLAALGAIHGAGLVHRDVKPANILRDANRWRVSDFGIVRDTTGATTVTQAGMIIGTPDYLAPEHFREGPVGPAADLYALGAMLYHALAGTPPYRADNSLRLAMLHATAPAPALPDAVRGTDPELASLVDGLLRKDPGDRLTIRGAEGILAGEADGATLVAMAGAGSPSGTPTMVLRPRRRRRGLYAIATALAVATLALGATWIAGDRPSGGPAGADATAPATAEPVVTAPRPAPDPPETPTPVVSPPVSPTPATDRVDPDDDEEYVSDEDHDDDDEQPDDRGEYDDEDDHHEDVRHDERDWHDHPAERSRPGKKGRGKAKGHAVNPGKHTRHH